MDALLRANQPFSSLILASRHRKAQTPWLALNLHEMPATQDPIFDEPGLWFSWQSNSGSSIPLPYSAYASPVR